MVNCAPVVRFVNINPQKTSSSTKKPGTSRSEMSGYWLRLTAFSLSPSLKRVRGSHSGGAAVDNAKAMIPVSLCQFPYWVWTVSLLCFVTYLSSTLVYLSYTRWGWVLGSRNEGLVRMPCYRTRWKERRELVTVKRSRLGSSLSVSFYAAVEHRQSEHIPGP